MFESFTPEVIKMICIKSRCLPTDHRYVVASIL